MTDTPQKPKHRPAPPSLCASPPDGRGAVNPKYEENLSLLAASRAGDKRAAERLMALNGGLVNHIAMRFLGRGYELEDLVQIGNMGLFKAIRTFDPARACAFSTYAVPLIFGEIRRFLRDDGPIKVSRTQKRLGARLAAAREQFAAEGRGDVRLSELAERCGTTPEEAAAALDAIAPVTSLSESVYREEDGGPTVESTLTDEDEGERSFNRLAISMAIDKLPALRRKIVLLRYFRDYSQSETAAALGLTQVKVSREEKKILAFLRTELADGS